MFKDVSVFWSERDVLGVQYILEVLGTGDSGELEFPVAVSQVVLQLGIELGITTDAPLPIVQLSGLGRRVLVSWTGWNGSIGVVDRVDASSKVQVL